MEDIEFVLQLMDELKDKLKNGERITDDELRRFDVLLRNKRLLQNDPTSIQGYSDLSGISSDELKESLRIVNEQ